MAATFTTANAYTLSEYSQFYESDGKISTILNLLAKDDPILQHVLWKQGNQLDGHKGKILTALPTAAFRRLYQGTPYSKAGVASIMEPTRQISTRWGIDVDELAMYEGDAAQGAFRLQEGMLHIEALRQFATNQLIYGGLAKDSMDDLRGLAARYPTATSPNVVNAAGASTGCTSIYGVVWGESDLHGIFPKNMPGGIQHEDLGRFDAEDASGNKYRAVGDEWKWNIGFFLKDWRCVVRICNIKVANLLLPSTDGNYIDLQKYTIQAKNKIPVGKRGRMVWYVPEAVMTALEVQSLRATNTYLKYGEAFNSQDVLKMHGKPVYQCDSISENETAI
jgi:hypothetical protein